MMPLEISFADKEQWKFNKLNVTAIYVSFLIIIYLNIYFIPWK